ncbi:MAG: RNA 2'-phosphotransferase [Solirubrobacteraceae bacterium]|nr:RNA 2'-phosphotransferase [Solirubrobacteraceae bacterium]
MNQERASKFLSLVLRHKPEEIGLTLDAEGWADIAQLIALANKKGTPLTRELLIDIVANSDKQRFAIDANGTRIRANQGHSVAVDLKLAPKVPPAQLFHGTASRFVASIREQGLHAGARQHVHLSPDIETATKVGTRHGQPRILVVNAAAMHRYGFVFFMSDNGVWHTDAETVAYIDFHE